MYCTDMNFSNTLGLIMFFFMYSLGSNSLKTNSLKIFQNYTAILCKRESIWSLSRKIDLTRIERSISVVVI